MFSTKQVSELKDHLERAQNPVFLYDNDGDGFCSFMLLKRYLGRGKGIAVRSHPDIDVGYAAKAKLLGADYLFVLDRPFLGDKFLAEISELGIQLVWIDHHDVLIESNLPDWVHVFNPARGHGTSEPVTALVYSLTKRKEDSWIAVAGCISDNHLPSFYKTFEKEYPDLSADVKIPFDVYYKTGIGRIARAISFGLKDSITHVVYMQNFFAEAVSPQDVFSELETVSSFAKKYKETNKKYVELLETAKEQTRGKLVFFEYGGTMSISADLANELSYLYPGKYIGVAYINGLTTNVSLRGKNIRSIFERVIVKMENVSGGGHPDAIGARIRATDLDTFKKLLEEEIES